jgi:hypothetical protein
MLVCIVHLLSVLKTLLRETGMWSACTPVSFCIYLWSVSILCRVSYDSTWNQLNESTLAVCVIVTFCKLRQVLEITSYSSQTYLKLREINAKILLGSTCLEIADSARVIISPASYHVGCFYNLYLWNTHTWRPIGWRSGPQKVANYFVSKYVS